MTKIASGSTVITLTPGNKYTAGKGFPPQAIASELLRLSFIKRITSLDNTSYGVAKWHSFSRFRTDVDYKQCILCFSENSVVIQNYYQEGKHDDQKTEKIRALKQDLIEFVIEGMLREINLPLQNMEIFSAGCTDLETSLLLTCRLYLPHVCLQCFSHGLLMLLIGVCLICLLTLEESRAGVSDKIKRFLVWKSCKNAGDELSELLHEMQYYENKIRKDAQYNGRLHKTRTCFCVPVETNYRLDIGNLVETPPLSKVKFDSQTKPDKKCDSLDSQSNEDTGSQQDKASVALSEASRHSDDYGNIDAGGEEETYPFPCFELQSKLQLFQSRVHRTVRPTLDEKGHQYLPGSSQNFSNYEVFRPELEKAMAPFVLSMFPSPLRRPFLQRPHSAPVPRPVVPTPQELRRHMRQQNFRIASMVHLHGVRTVAMSEAGLYLDEDEDVFRCFHCSLQVPRGEWPSREDPLQVHRRLSPACPVANPSECGDGS